MASPLRPHQLHAVQDIVDTLTTHPRGLLAMPCGTGKSRTAVTAADRIASVLDPHDGRILIVVPYLALVRQLLGEAAEAVGADELGRVLAVCSDPHILSPLTRDNDIRGRVTSRPDELAALLAPPGRATVASTYDSLPTLAAAHRLGLRPWTVTIADESHRSAGREDKPWGIIHDDDAVPSRRRIYATATPWIVSGTGIVGMDDETVFGPRAHTLTSGKAVADNLLAPCRTLVPVITDAAIRDAARRASDNGGTYYHLGPGAALAPDMLASQLAILRAAHEYGIRRLITYHPSIAQARAFATTLEQAIRLLPPDERPTTLWAGHIDSTQPRADQRATLDRLRTPTADDNTLVVVANVQMLREGIDLPAVDAVALFGDWSSYIAVTQAIGRAQRRGDPRVPKVGYIIVPAVLGPDQDPAAALESTQWSTVVQVCSALAAADEDLAAEFIEARRAQGSAPRPHSQPRLSTGEPPSWLRVTGVPAPEDFARAVTVRAIHAFTSSWEERYGAARAFFLEHGHLAPPDDHVAPSGVRLGAWLKQLRRPRTIVSAHRRRQLDAIGMCWTPQDRDRARLLADLSTFHAEHGHVNVPHAYVCPEPDGQRLDGRVNKLRARGRASVPAAYARQLESLGFEWTPAQSHRAQFLADLRAYRDQHGDLLVPVAYTVGDPPRALGQQVNNVRNRHARGDRVDPELDAMGFVWNDVEARWHTKLAVLIADGTDPQDMSARYATGDGVEIGRWLWAQRKAYRDGTLTPARAAALRAAGVDLGTRKP
ncbi:Helicase associated domain protein [Embleya sp. NPDC059237]|uniref:DEAD/DEAH box helicase n=1 Tax=Embleya sp. NPDC059237 TaxID=3346784 RepID=UPI0036D1F883